MCVHFSVFESFQNEISVSFQSPAGACPSLAVPAQDRSPVPHPAFANADGSEMGPRCPQALSSSGAQEHGKRNSGHSLKI